MRITKIALILFVLATIVCGICTILRLHFVLANPESAIANTTGGEAISVYNSYLLSVGEKIYSDPRVFPVNCTMYNFLFYRYVSLVAQSLEFTDLPFTARCRFAVFLTTALLLIIILRISSGTLRGNRHKQLIFLTAILLAPVFLSWWMISCRPDLIAACFSTLAFVIYQRYLRPSSHVQLMPMFIVSVCFVLAWCFKQNCVQLFVFTACSLLLRKSFVPLCVLIVPMILVIALTFAIGGPGYFENTIGAARVGSYTVNNAISITINYLIKSAGAFLLFGSLLLLTNRPKQMGEWYWCLGVTFFLSAASASRSGSSNHYFFENFCVLIAACCRLSDLLDHPSAGSLSRMRMLLSTLLLLGCFAHTIAQESMKFVSTRFGTLRPKSGISPETDLNNLRQQYLHDKPCFVESEWLSLPYEGTQIPAFVMSDDIYYSRTGYYKDVIYRLIQSNYFATLVLLRSNEDYANQAVRSGYRQVFDSGDYVVYKATRRTMDQ